MCNIRWYRYVVIVSVSVDLWVNAIIGTVVVLSPPQRLLLVNTRERNGSGKKRERGGRFFPLPSVPRAF